MAPQRGQLAAAVLVALTLPLMACAQSKVRVFGDRFYHPAVATEWVRTYVDMPKDHDGDTMPLAVGIQITPGFLRRADELPITFNDTVKITSSKPTVSLPDSSLPVGDEKFPWSIADSKDFEYAIHFPQVGRNPFKFVQYTYNLHGHPPVGVYDFQHFDMRFFFVDPEWWKSQFPPSGWWATLDPEVIATERCGGGGPDSFYRSNLPIPEGCWPGDPTTNVNLAHTVGQQGSHIYNLEEPGWQAYLKGSGVGTVDSLTWGMQDGQIAYIEAMFARDLALEADLDNCIDFPELVPKHFDTERAAPTRKCLVAGEKTIKLEYSNFISVPGGCEEMRKTDTLVGYTSQEIATLLHGPKCLVPVP